MGTLDEERRTKSEASLEGLGMIGMGIELSPPRKVKVALVAGWTGHRARVWKGIAGEIPKGKYTAILLEVIEGEREFSSFHRFSWAVTSAEVSGKLA